MYFRKANSLAYTLKDVQSANRSLEEMLNMKRNQRRNAEHELESVNMKLAQVTDLQTRMTENLKIAQHKVAQTHAQSDSIQANYKDKTKQLKKVESKITELHEARTSNTEKFEEELSKLSRFMIEEKEEYAESKLKGKIEESEKSIEASMKNAESLDEELTQASDCLTSININDSKLVNCDDIDKESIWNLVDEEQRSALKYLQTLNEEIEAVKTAVTSQS